jgi:peptide/nickel transport system permease protein
VTVPGSATHGSAPDGPATDGPATDGPATDGPATDGSATSGMATSDATAAPGRRPRRAWVGVIRRAASLPRGRFGLTVVGLVVAVAVIGPFVAPHSATASIVGPFSRPSGQALLGGDELGRDVVSRVLDGGWVLLVMALAATAIGVGIGAASGIAAAYLQGRWDGLIMRTVDVILAFPQLVFALLLVSIIGPKIWLTVLAVGLSHAPQVARVLRAAALDVSERDFVKATELLGVRRRRIMTREILPNLVSPLMVEGGLRLTYSIVIIAGLAFLGFGQAPPAPDWGIMINENRIGLVLNPWSVVVPAALIALLTIGINTFTDAVARVSIGIDRAVETGAPVGAGGASGATGLGGAAGTAALAGTAPTTDSLLGVATVAGDR